MSESTPPLTASKRAASPFSSETGATPKRAREETIDETSDVIPKEDEASGEEKGNGNETGNGTGEVVKMDDVPMDG